MILLTTFLISLWTVGEAANLIPLKHTLTGKSMAPETIATLVTGLAQEATKYWGEYSWGHFIDVKNIHRTTFSQTPNKDRLVFQHFKAAVEETSYSKEKNYLLY